MGTRVDFYSGRGEEAEWLGSYPFDGFPGSVFDVENTFAAPTTDEQWRAWVTNWLTDSEHGDRSTLPEMGWPWPWETSATTDYAYAWDEGVVYGSSFGHEWFRVDPAAENFGEPEEDDGDKSAVFPNMAHRRDVTYGPRSGLIIISGR